MKRDGYARSLYDRLVTGHSGKPAVYQDGRWYAYDEIDGLVSRFCTFLQRKGIKAGDLVLLSAFDSLEFIVAFLACLRSGVIAGPFDPLIGGDDLDRILAETRPRAVLCTGNVCRARNIKNGITIADDDSSDLFFSLMRGLDKSGRYYPVRGTDPAFLLFTSGTTGEPKGVLHRYGDLLLDTYPRTILRLTQRDVLFSCSPIYTSYGLGNSLVFPFLSGAKVVLSRAVPNPFSLERILRSLRPTVFCAVPSIYELLLDYRARFKRLFARVRLFVVAGEKLGPELFAKWRQGYGASLLEHYGASEMFHPFVSNAPGRERAGSCGRVLDGFDVRLDAKGRISFSGPTLFTRYWGNAALTKKVRRNGYFRSDDIGYRDPRGYLFIRGRDNLVLKLNGRWISLADIENTLRRIRGVRDAAAVKRGNRLEYYVSLKDGGDPRRSEQRIKAHFAAGQQHHLIPRRVVFLDRIPRTRSGKIIRRKLETHDEDK